MVEISHQLKNAILHCYMYLGQCPAKSGLLGYNFITIKMKIDFCDLHIFRAVDTIIVNTAG